MNRQKIIINLIPSLGSIVNSSSVKSLFFLKLQLTSSVHVLMFYATDVQSLEELSLSLLTHLEEVVKEQRRWRDIAEANVRLLRDFAFQEWLCSQSLEHYYHT